MLRRRGVRMISINEPEVEGSMAVLVEPLLAAVGESFIAQIAEDTLRGLKEIARQAFSGGGRPPRGYRAVKKVVGLKRSGEPNGSRTVALNRKPLCHMTKLPGPYNRLAPEAILCPLQIRLAGLLLLRLQKFPCPSAPKE